MVKAHSQSDWTLQMVRLLKPYEQRVVCHVVFREIGDGTLSLEKLNRGLVYFYPLVESFPQFLGLILTKAPPGTREDISHVRDWLINNIGVERNHARWWKKWAVDFGVPPNVFEEEISLPPEIDALNNYLWRVSHASLPEAIGAVNWAIEGPTGIWTKNLKTALRAYIKQGAKVTKTTLRWVDHHASYDDRHPIEALEIVKTQATSVEERKRVIQAAQRSFEYYALALDYFYQS